MRSALAAFLLALALPGASEARQTQTPDPQAPAAVTLGQAPEAGESTVVEALEVIARPRGPALWIVTRGQSQVTIIGGYGPLPHSLEWDHDRLDRALTGADGFYEPKASINPIEIAGIFFNPGAFRLGGGRRLDDLIGPARQERLRRIARIAKADPGRMQPFKPAVAGILAYQTFLREAGLSPEKPGTTIRRLVRAKHVPTRALAKVAAASVIRSIQRMDDPAQIACLDAILDQIEWESGHAVAAAKAWSEGRIAELRRQRSTAILDRCIPEAGGSRAVLDKGIADSAGSIADLLRRPGRSVALIDLALLLPRNGVLDRLKAQGAQISVPLD